MCVHFKRVGRSPRVSTTGLTAARRVYVGNAGRDAVPEKVGLHYSRVTTVDATELLKTAEDSYMWEKDSFLKFCEL